ncbi:MAG: cation transporter [Deltaproteobacteria bacterium]|nr:cation transporter [Deltaproteobacteria bacterium]
MNVPNVASSASSDELVPAPDGRVRAGVLSVVVSVVLLGAKLAAWRLTGSTAVLSDALESIVNVVASSLALFTLIVGSRPADLDHPYGHGKAEEFSAGVEGALIVVAAVLILVEAIPAIHDPAPIANLDSGLLIVAGAGLVNLAVGSFLIRRGKAVRSAALVADGQHLLTDVVTTAAVLVGLGLVRITGLGWIDPVAASLVAVQILVSGVRIVRKSVGHLMDEADPELVGRILAALTELRRPGLLEPHRLRVLRQGRHHHIDLHLVVPRFWTVEEAHGLEQMLGDEILDRLGAPGDAIVHLDPCMSYCCPLCTVEGCPVRAHPFERERVWTVESATGAPPWKDISTNEP